MTASIQTATLLVKAPAKINLNFEIIRRFPDGYHEVCTLLQAVSLEDEIRFDISPAKQFTFELGTVSGPQRHGFPKDASNLIVKAAQAYFQAINESPEILVRAEVKKNIPVGAGLAGGSANAAATLTALNRYMDNRLSEDKLHELAATLGADVPFSLLGGTVLGTSRGDKLEALAALPKLTFLLIKPRHLSISTPWVYQTYDRMQEEDFRPNRAAAEDERALEKRISVHKKAVALAENLVNNEIEIAAKQMVNDFEQIVFDNYRELAKLRHSLLAEGALSCRLTGSGPTLVALVKDAEQGQTVRDQFHTQQVAMCEGLGCKNKTDEIDSWIVETVDYGARIVE